MLFFMEIKLHSNANTTPRTRKYIKTSKKSDSELAKELGISIDTVRKWRRRDSVIDKSHRPNVIHRRLNAEQEWIILYLRKRLMLSLDELLDVGCELINKDLSRSSLSRCLKKNNVPRVVKSDISKLGEVIVDIVQVPPEIYAKNAYLIVFTEVYTSYISFALINNFNNDSKKKLISFLTESLPYDINKFIIQKNEDVESLLKMMNVEYDVCDNELMSFNSGEISFDFKKDISDIISGVAYDERLGLPSILLSYEDILNKRIIRKRLKNLTPNGYFIMSNDEK